MQYRYHVQLKRCVSGTRAIVATMPGSQYVKGKPSCCTALVTTRASIKHHQPAHATVGYLECSRALQPQHDDRGCDWHSTAWLGDRPSVHAAPAADADTSLTSPKECPGEYGCPGGKALSHAIPVHVSPDPGLHPVAHAVVRLGQAFRSEFSLCTIASNARRKPITHVMQRAATSASLSACLLCCRRRPLYSALRLQAETDQQVGCSRRWPDHSCGALRVARASQKVCQCAFCFMQLKYVTSAHSERQITGLVASA